MSENYIHYATKIAEKRAGPIGSASLRRHLEELYAVVQRCEAMWALENRIDRRP